MATSPPNSMLGDRAAVDVAVIGAGPAGCSAARLLATWGHRVALITRPAARPALAESIPPSTGRLLDHLGWRAIIDHGGFVRSTGNTFIWDRPPLAAHGASRATAGADEGHAGDGDSRFTIGQAYYENGALGWQVDRAVLNRILLDATAQGGVGGDGSIDVVAGATVIGVQGGVVRYRHSAGDGETWARWVLDCSGRAGVVARLGWRRSVPRLRTLAIAGIWERSDTWPRADPTHTVVESHRDGWAWSIPVSATQRHVTVMVDPRLTNVGSAGALTSAYHAELARAQGLHALTRGATLMGDPFARDASPYAAHQVAAPNVLLVGDAASFVDPLSSYGIKKALASAWLAAVVVHTCSSDAAMVRPALAFYESRERAMYDALERQRAELAQAALRGERGEPSAFWAARAEADVGTVDAPNEDVDVEQLRGDADIQAAFDELKRRDTIALSVGPGVERAEQPAVRENRIIKETRLRSPAFPHGIRYVRNVDLLTLVDLAPRVAQVADLYDAYCRGTPPVPLGDFLGALALLVAKRVLVFA